MKKRLLMILTLAILLVGCGDKEETDNTIAGNQTTTETPSTDEATTNQSSTPEAPTPTEDSTTPEEPTEPPHEHAYTETVTTEATCETDGVKTFTCDCDDSYTETIEASGHNFAEYVYNNDATYEADGTETATCVCGLTDTRTAEGSKLELPAEPNLYGMTFDKGVKWTHVYCLENTDVYFEPSFSAPSIGKLSINDEVGSIKHSSNVDAIYNYPPYDKTESPTEIMWAKISYNGQTGYVPYKYLWAHKRDTSITLNPLALNYPTVNGLGSGIVYPPTDGNWYYVYGAAHGTVVKLNPYCEFAEIYDGTSRNVIGTITDTNTSLQLTGHAYAYYQGGGTGHRYIYEVYYNGQIAYIDDLTTYSE
ncbi:MAG: hypothetical protein IKB01_00030 [Lachnospiraceae bacterium]|nr:hypothetical protein [Lachnospiraceae bacterium]